MRLITGSCVLLTVFREADAHTLAGDAGMPAQLGHQFFGLHHLPLTAILAIAGVLILRRWYRVCRPDKGGAQ